MSAGVGVIAATTKYYASHQPLFRFASTTLETPICLGGSVSFSTTSSFENVAFRKDTANTAEVYIFDFKHLTTGDKFIFNTLDFSNVKFKNVDCYECTLPLMRIDTKTLIFG